MATRTLEHLHTEAPCILAMYHAYEYTQHTEVLKDFHFWSCEEHWRFYLTTWKRSSSQIIAALFKTRVKATFRKNMTLCSEYDHTHTKNVTLCTHAHTPLHRGRIWSCTHTHTNSFAQRKNMIKHIHKIPDERSQWLFILIKMVKSVARVKPCTRFYKYSDVPQEY